MYTRGGRRPVNHVPTGGNIDIASRPSFRLLRIRQYRRRGHFAKHPAMVRVARRCASGGVVVESQRDFRGLSGGLHQARQPSGDSQAVVRGAGFDSGREGGCWQDSTSFKSLLYYLSIMLLAFITGRRVVAFAQGIGLLEGEFSAVTGWRISGPVRFGLCERFCVVLILPAEAGP